ncbi:MAG: DUF5985 family protein [Pseudomonadota bacterium]|nr:DUF5985 family protein [Pseudomonadota bacterium]
MTLLVYLLCLITALGCAAVLFGAYIRTRAPLLFLAGMCFVGLAANDALVLIDVYVIPGTSLLRARRVVGFVAVALMLAGLIFHDKETSE